MRRYFMAEKKRKDKKGRILREGEIQLPDGNYIYHYYDIYGHRKKVYSWKLVPTDMAPLGTKQKKSLRELEAEIKADIVKKIDTYKSNVTTLNDRWELYCQELLIKHSTRSNYEYLWDKYVRGTIGKMKLVDINSSVVTKFYIDLYSDNCLSPSTIEHIHTLLNPIFNICVLDNLMTTNPASRAMQKIKNIAARSGNKKEERTILSPEQETSLFEFINSDSVSARWQNVFVVLLKTGARVSEVCGLTKNDIDLEEDIIHIRRNILYRKVDSKCQRFVSSTKTTASERDFPIYCDELRNALISAMNDYPDDGEEIDGVSGWLFRNRYGKLSLIENNCNDELRRILKAYNNKVNKKELKVHNFSCHNFRHTFASKCEMRDVSERVKKALLGHAPDKNNVTNRYVHLTPEYLLKEAKKLND